MRILIFISLSACLLICCGCGGTQVPEELRDLYPATVTVMDGDQPMAGILVTLFAKSGHGAYACNGVTDGKGAAQIQSSRGSYTGKGVPAGTYSVVLSENIVLPADLEPQTSDEDLSPTAQAEKERKRNEFVSKNRLVPSVLTTASSPTELVVAKGKNATVEIDVAKHR